MPIVIKLGHRELRFEDDAVESTKDAIRATDDGLERGTLLCQKPDGSVVLSNMTWGVKEWAKGGRFVAPAHVMNCYQSEVVGFIHTHPRAVSYLSAGDHLSAYSNFLSGQRERVICMGARHYGSLGKVVCAVPKATQSSEPLRRRYQEWREEANKSHGLYTEAEATGKFPTNGRLEELDTLRRKLRRYMLEGEAWLEI